MLALPSGASRAEFGEVWIMRHHLLGAVAAMTFATPAVGAPVFLLNDTGGVGANTMARSGFEAAAGLWASVLADNVTVRLDVGFRPLGSGILGQAGSARSDVGYSTVRSALRNDRKSASDNSAYSSLGFSLNFLSNEAGNCTTGSRCQPIDPASRTTDNDNTYDNRNLGVNTSVQKALGLRGDNGTVDAGITFSSSFNWDYDRSNGITGGFYDFVGIAAHEIGHALGFVSGVDVADGNVGLAGLDDIAWGSVLDLFRYTGTRRDWTIGGTPCTSINRGSSCVGLLSTGSRYGDGRQASHWKDNQGIGIMDPTAGAGEFLSISGADRIAFDVIGWDIALTAAQGGALRWSTLAHAPSDVIWDIETIEPFQVPEPALALLLGLGVTALGLARRRG